MPIYQYVCDDCGFEFERAQSFHDEPLETCPECGGTVRRVISPVGIIFKGSGWYITDSRRQISGSGSASMPAADRVSNDLGDGEKSAAPAADSSESGGGKNASESKTKPKEKTTTGDGAK